MTDPFRFRALHRAVGIFVLAALAVVVAGVLLMGRSRHWFESAVVVEVDVPAQDVGLLRPGLPVKMIGSPAGEVDVIDKAVRVDGAGTWVRVRLRLARSFRDSLRADAVAVIRTPVAGLFGETFVELVPGSALVPLGSGAALKARPQVDLVAEARLSVNQVGEMAGQVRDLVAENRAGVQQAVTALNQFIARVDALGAQVATVVGENRQDLKETTARLPGAVDAIRDGAREIGAGASEIRAAVAESRPAVKATFDNLVPVTASLDRLAADLGIITAQVAAGEGTLGKLVMEDTAHDRLTEATASLNQRIEELKPIIASILDLKLYAGIDGGGNLDSGVLTGHGYLRLEPKPWKFYQGGISYRTAPDDRNVDNDEGDGIAIDFNLVLGWRWFERAPASYILTVAGGLVESRVGGWVDLAILGEDRLVLRTLVRHKMNDRDEDDRRFEDGTVLVRSVLALRVWSRVYVQAGADDLVDEPAGWVGLRAELLDNDLRNLTQVTGLFR